jgi:hypothetical protein
MPVLTPAYTLRPAVAADADGLARLAGRDGKRALRGRVLVVAEGEDLVAAYSLDELRAVADPDRLVTVAKGLMTQPSAELAPAAARPVPAAAAPQPAQAVAA